jgi:hypothetical protein
MPLFVAQNDKRAGSVYAFCDPLGSIFNTKQLVFNNALTVSIKLRLSESDCRTCSQTKFFGKRYCLPGGYADTWILCGTLTALFLS